MARTVVALILREMATTYGRSAGGYIWAILEPVLGVALLSAVFSMALQHPGLGTNFPLFYATGFLPFAMFNDVANKVARDMVVSPHRDGGQAQFIETPIGPQIPGTDHLSATMTWAVEHLSEPLSVAELAAHTALSPRQFTRQFRARTGTSPHQWLLTQRTGLAQRLLETTTHSVEQIADEAGFGTAAAMRLHFQRALHTSPAAYRRCFQGECRDPERPTGEFVSVPGT